MIISIIELDLGRYHFLMNSWEDVKEIIVNKCILKEKIEEYRWECG